MREGIVYVSGDFTSIGGQTRRGLAALDATSGAATAWDPDPQSGTANGVVNSLVLDGNTLYAGGAFEGIGGEGRNGLAAFDATSGAVTAWNPNANGPALNGGNNAVGGLAVDEDIVYEGLGFIDDALRPQGRIVALDKTTALPVWEVKANGSAGVALDGNTVYVSGSFSSIGAPPRNNIAALDATSGALTPWDPNADGAVNALAVNGSSVYAGGSFTSIGGQTRNNIAAIDATSGLATALWDPNADGAVNALAVDGSTVYAGGAFTIIGGQTRNNIAALDATSGLVTAWDPNAAGAVNALRVDGNTIYAGGAFTNIGGQTHNRIAALDATNGTATAWNPNANNTVRALALDGGIVYAGGAFTNIGGQSRNRIAALNAATGAPTAWNPNASGLTGPSVMALAVDGNTVYAGGRFLNIGGQTRPLIAAIDATSGLATAWNPDFLRLTLAGALPPSVNALVVGGGTVYAGGNFRLIGGKPRSCLAGFGPLCTPPVIAFCPPDVTVECGNSTSPSNTGTATATGTGVSVGFSDAFVAGCGNTGVITRTWTATGTCGTASREQEITIVDTTAPVVTITGPAIGPVYAVGTAVNFAGSFTDNCGSPHTATWMFDALTQPGTVVEGAPGTVNASNTFTAAGVYMVKLTVTDNCGNVGTADQIGDVDAMVVVYDPNAGFVAGTGWINSPPEAYTANPLLTGKANFGFVSKYKKGANVPTGETEFKYKVGNLDFLSTSYDWLVVSGARAQYKGSGTINNAGNYGFMLSCVDGQISGGGGLDKFRIKITDKTDNTLVYDNMLSAPDTATASTVIGAGSIDIHTGGKSTSAVAGGPRAEDGGEESLSASIPVAFGLSQNHPNPFDRSTLIDFSLPERSRVSLVVYDLVGREVRTLADGEWEPGRHSATLAKTSSNGGTLGAGVYFVRMNAQSLASGRSFTSLKKMVLLK